MSYLGPSLRRRRGRAWTGWRLLAAVALSVALNLLVLRLVQVDWAGGVAAKEAVRPVGLAPLSAESWAANRRVADGSRPAPPQAKLPLPPLVPKQEPVKMPGQVVAVAPSENDKAPANARFLSESNNTVEKETVSRFRKPGYEHVAPSPTGTQPAPEAPRRGEVAKAEVPGAKGGDVRRPGAPGPVAKLSPAPKPAPERVALQDPEGLKPPEPPRAPKSGSLEAAGQGGEGGEGAAQPGSKGQPILRPTAAFYEKLQGGPAPDHVEGVDVGDSTFLNTREWKYAGFWNRVKEAVSQHWDVASAVRTRDPGGERFFYKDRSAILSVTLDDRGALMDVRVSRSSGLDFLDQTAIDAVQKAQPFPNPPQALVDSRGEISFPFGFYVEVGGGGFGFFRPRIPGQGR